MLPTRRTGGAHLGFRRPRVWSERCSGTRAVPCHGGTKAREVRSRAPVCPAALPEPRMLVVPPDPRLVGRWRRTLLVRPDGGTDDTSSVTWLQAGSGYVDLRLPAGTPPTAGPVTGLGRGDLLALAAAEGFAGRLRADGAATCWDRTVDLTPDAPPDEGLLETHDDGATLVETGRHVRYLEHWVRDGDHGDTGEAAACCAAELRDPDTGAAAVLVRVGDDVGWARARPVPLPPGVGVADAAASGDPALVRLAFDTEVAFGVVAPDGGVVLTASSRPGRVGARLDLVAEPGDGDLLHGTDTAPDGTAVCRRWSVVAAEGPASALPVSRPGSPAASREVHRA